MIKTNAFLKEKRNFYISFFILAVVLILNFSALHTVKDAMASQRHVPITCVQRNDNIVALTCNLTSDSNIELILEKLGTNKATFFISQDYIHENPDTVKEIINKGHTIGLLESQLKNMERNSIFDLMSERIEETTQITGVNCNLIRIEHNRYDGESINAILSIGLYPVQWSTDSSADDFSSGDIILINEECDYERLFANIEKNGCKTTTVDDLLIKGSYCVDINGTMIPVI